MSYQKTPLNISLLKKIGYWLRDGFRILLLVGLLFLLAEAVTRLFFPPTVLETAEKIPQSLREAGWFPTYLREFDESKQSEWHSYVYWRRKSYQGKTINIDSSGIRKTESSAFAPEAAFKIWCYGGSTMWGTFARDAYTIPSLIAKGLKKQKIKNIAITNWGESGYVSTQELIHLTLALKNGSVPDVLIFYDGVNDVFSALQNSAAGIPENEINRVREFNLLQKNIVEVSKTFGLRHLLTRNSLFLRKLFTLRENNKMPLKQANVQHLEKLAAQTIETYFENVRHIQKLAKEYGFTCLFFWQPVLFSRQNLPAEEKIILDVIPQEMIDFYQLAYQKIASLQTPPPNFYDLQKVFDTDTTVYFGDYCHTSEAGNAIVAEAILETLLTKAIDFNRRDH